MTQETDLENQPNEQTQQPTFSKEDLEKTFKIRMQKQNEKYEEELRNMEKRHQARLEELEKKISSGNASKSESHEYNTAQVHKNNTNDAVSQNMVSVDDAERFARTQVSLSEFQKQMKEAAAKDEEFKNLMDTGHPLSVTQQAFIAQMPIENKAAVIKQLLKSAKDHDMFNTACSTYDRDDGLAAKRLIYNLSEEIENSISKPGPSTFKPAPNLQDVGKGEDFDVDEYVNSNY